MNHWMMTGDWGTAPMNRRGPVIQNPYPVVPPVSDEVVDLVVAAASGHYDIAVMDDPVSQVGTSVDPNAPQSKFDREKTLRIMKAMSAGDFAAAVFNLPAPSWAQKQLMEALVRGKRLWR